MTPLPWDALADALEALQAAMRSAAEAPDPPARLAAQLDAGQAASDAESARWQMGLVAAALLRELRDQFPKLWGEVADELGVNGPTAAAINDAVSGIQRQVEWCAAEVQRIRAENWELAGEVIKLQREIETLHYEREQQEVAHEYQR